MSDLAYDVFVSYAHAARPALSERICKRLRVLGRRWYRFSALRLYRDTTTLAATETLWPTIATAIGESQHFLLIASPEAARSPWVQREVDHYLSARERLGPDRQGRLLIALVEGSIAWRDDAGEFDWEKTDALPRTLEGRFSTEPLYVDFTPFELPLDRSRRRALTVAVARLSGGFMGVSTDEILSADRSAKRRLRIAAGAATIILAGGAGSAIYFTGAAREKERSLAAQLARRAKASNLIPQQAPRLGRVRRRPIREVELRVREATLPRDGSALELRVTHDEVFSQPMQFFVSAFREGRTWPSQLSLPEPSGVDYTNCGASQVAAHFQWYDVKRSLTPTLPLEGDPFAYLPFEFTGKRFDPPGPFSLPQRLELPSIRRLVDQGATFQLFRHRPGESEPEAVDRASAVELQFVVLFREPENDEFALFRSRHTRDQREVLGIDYLFKRPAIEKEALLTLYPQVAEPREAVAFRDAYRRIERGGTPRTRGERAIDAALEMTEGSVWAGRGEVGRARTHYARALDALGTPPHDGSPTMLREVCIATVVSLSLVALSDPEDPRTLALAANAIKRQRDATVATAHPALRRGLSLALLNLAEVAANAGDTELAADSLREAVDEATRLDKEVSTSASAGELRQRLDTATSLATSLGLGDSLPIRVWSRRARERSSG